eukprot:3649469-Amphidinium_carterae.1
MQYAEESQGGLVGSMNPVPLFPFEQSHAGTKHHNAMVQTLHRVKCGTRFKKAPQIRQAWTPSVLWGASDCKVLYPCETSLLVPKGVFEAPRPGRWLGDGPVAAVTLCGIARHAMTIRISKTKIQDCDEFKH